VKRMWVPLWLVDVFYGPSTLSASSHALVVDRHGFFDRGDLRMVTHRSTGAT